MKEFSEIDSLFSNRTKNALLRANYNTIEKVMSLSRDDLLELHSMGEKSVNEVLNFQAENKGKPIDLIKINFCNEVTEYNNPMFIQIAFPESLGRNITSIVYRNSFGDLVSDIDVEELKFSVRTMNGLRAGGFTSLNQVAWASFDDVKNIQNVGTKSISELLDFFKLNADISYEEDKYDDDLEKIFTLICTVSDTKDKFYQSLKKVLYLNRIEIKTLLDTYDIKTLVLSREFIGLIEGSKEVRDSYKNYILSKLQDFYDDDILSEDYFFKTGLYQKAISELLNENKIEKNEGHYIIRLPRIIEWLDSIDKENHRKALCLRLEGKTLEECGQELGISRERARQIITKSISRKPVLYEDKYSYWYEKYDLNRESFISVFVDDTRIYEYLDIVYKRGNIPIDEILEDERATRDIYLKTSRYIQRNKVLIGEEYVPCKREAICRKLAEINCSDKDISIDDFYEIYQNFIIYSHLEKEERLLFPSKRAFYARIEDSMFFLIKLGRVIRYYPIEEIDAELFVKELNLEQFIDVEISTLKIMQENIELMKEYDIRDEYELHNFLKKTSDKLDLCNRFNISFSRMPMLAFGKSDRKKQTVDLLMQVAPVSMAEFCEFFEMEYGVLARTVMANFTPYISEYYHNGIFTIDQPQLCEDEREYLISTLTDDFYFIEDIKKIFIKRFSNSDGSKINPRSLKELGFKVYTNYVIGNRFSSSFEYFKEFLTREDVINLQNQDKRLTYIQIENAVLEELRSSYDLLEYEDMKFIKFSRLKSVYPDISKSDIDSYVDEVLRFSSEEKFFTIKKLKEKGFCHRFHEISLPEWFVAALVKNSRKIRFIKSGNSIIFYNGNRQFTTVDFLRDIIKEKESIDIYEFLSYLKQEYGLVYSKEQITQFIKKSTIYYDPIMDKIYCTKEKYYEEI